MSDTPLLIATGAEILFYLLLIAFTFDALFLAYHWFTYGTSHTISLAGLTTYLAGGAILFITYAYALSLL